MIGNASGWNDHDCVLVTLRHDVFWRKFHIILRHGNLSQLDIPVLCEFMPADLHGAANHVGRIGALSFRPSLFSPTPLCRHPAQHTGFTASDCRATGRGSWRCVPQFGEHCHTSLFNPSSLRIFVLIDEVLVDTLSHECMDLLCGRCLTKSCKVLLRVTINEKLFL